MDDYLSTAEVAAWTPDLAHPEPGQYKAQLRQNLQRAGQWNDDQLAGRRWAIGCVSLEITQRCNLDCTLCYLSDASEAVKDLPLEEVFRRIDDIYRHFGPQTDVQVSGGDPTLRKREELVAIVRRIRESNMRPTLFTNGIKASRDLLQELADNGLLDVAFHVDLTQERKGYATEADLNEIRANYVERARGLPLSVFFNTTVFDGNFEQIPDVVRFFAANADVVNLASFQLQADTGRGVLRERQALITRQSVAAQISKGAGTQVQFDVPVVGHPKCNQYALCLEAGGTLHNLYDHSSFITGMLRRTVHLSMPRSDRKASMKVLRRGLWEARDYWGRALVFFGRKLWSMRKDILRARGRINKLSFFLHNFMDAEALERDRCTACIFMAATSDGPISMCVHNAKRDDYILKPTRVATATGPGQWNPLTGETTADQTPSTAEAGLVDFIRNAADPNALPLKRLKGRARQQALRRKQLSENPQAAAE